MQKRKGFSNSSFPFPPTRLDPGSCQAARIDALLSKPVNRVPATPEWLAENQAKQRAYEERFRARQKEIGLVESK